MKTSSSGRWLALLALILAACQTTNKQTTVAQPAALAPAAAAAYETKPGDPYFAKFNPRLAPLPGPLLLQTGDRLAIVGDSITEQKMYSRIMETYLTVCVPQLKITVRQVGWSGETAEGFRKRMESDCLRFKPTVATFAYGMNDSKYRPYDDLNGQWYASNYTAIVRAFKAAGARVVLGSPGSLGTLNKARNAGGGTLDERNLNLCAMRDLDIRAAQSEGVRFADVFWPMLQAAYEGENRYGTADKPFALPGPDGLHPNWAGHLVMARCFLRALGLDGDIGTFTVDLKGGHAEVTAGHKLESFANGELTITSTRYPFCDGGATNATSAIRGGMSLVPFNQELNRLMLVVKNIGTPRCQVIWGGVTNTCLADQLAAGINLADDFAVNPFSQAFQNVDKAVAAKQAYETRQIKTSFHSAEARTNMDAVVLRTEAERAPLVEAMAAAFVPVRHVLRLVPVQE
ncbi:MAG: SGNH/GDSL hydrolase family protein [Verrucomicrobiota bacterium]|jgi:lysophospholipase L1-like esterase